MVEPKAEHHAHYRYIPPRAISDSTRWRPSFLNGVFVARRANSIILIICIHKELSEEGMVLRKACAASMRLLHSATFVFRSVSLPGCFCGSFGGRKTCSMTERKRSESRLSVVGADMTIQNETVDAESREMMPWQRVRGHVLYARLGYRSLCPKCMYLSRRADNASADKDIHNYIACV